jgi:hypothetical protein
MPEHTAKKTPSDKNAAAKKAEKSKNIRLSQNKNARKTDDFPPPIKTMMPNFCALWRKKPIAPRSRCDL